MTKKRILLTFDYEPFLGAKSGTTQKCIIEPTDILIKILTKHHTKAVFFVDTLYIENLKRNDQIRDYECIKDQINRLFLAGHYIFPHIHPHWLDAKFDKSIRQFDLSNLTRYSLSSVGQQEVAELFKESISTLKELGVLNNNWGYRAGGWCIQPFSKYNELFKELNIKYDFSVLPGYKNSKPEQYFDFSTVAKKTPYNFDNDVIVEISDGYFLEFPISVFTISDYTKLISRVVNKFLWKTGDRGIGDGIGAQTSALSSTNSNVEMMSVDILNIAKLNSYKAFFRNNDYLHFISHPKMFTRHALKVFDLFLEFGLENFSIEFDFKRF